MNITNEMLGTTLDGIVTNATASVSGKLDKETGEPSFPPVTCQLEFDWSDVTLADVLSIATGKLVIRWANTHRSDGAEYVSDPENWKNNVREMLAGVRVAKIVTSDDAINILKRAREIGTLTDEQIKEIMNTIK